MSQKVAAAVTISRPSRRQINGGSVKPPPPKRGISSLEKKRSTSFGPKQTSRQKLVMEQTALATQLAAAGNEQQKNEEKEVDQETLDIFHRVFTGHFDEIPQPMSKLVRVFTSSTFTDTTLERNALMEDVYPALKMYCRETHGLDFQVVDMRWGVRDEATDDHMTTNLCINEIHNCQKLSMGPNFVVFLCQKYGYRPLPSEIYANEFELLKRTLKEQSENIQILDIWYIEDLNSVPSQVILQPISSILINFNNKRIPKLQEQDARAWWAVEGEIQQLLRKGSKFCYEKGYFTYEQMHNYFMSVTEREVIHGILKAPVPNEHCLCYVRHIQNININQTNTASKFTDIVHKQVNIEAQKLLANLRDERVPSKLCAKNIRRSTVEWAGREGMDVHAHAEYLKEFCRDFYSSITTQVDNAMRKYDKFRDDLFAEILQHLSNGKAGAEMFFGRSQELMHAKEYLISENNLPLIFHGENGCGKTSIMAKIATECRGWLTDAVEPVLILRFLGTSPDSSSISPLLNSLCEQIAHNYNPILKTQCPTEVSKLFLHYKKMMSLATKEKPLIMILDSLDQLSKIDSAEELLWFPPQLPSYVKVIVSFSSNTTIEGNMNKLVEHKNQYILVPSLGDDLGLEVIQRWLKSINRTLTNRQYEIVKKALNHCTLPLFVKLVYATVARWKSYSKPQDTILFKSVQQSVHALFDRTESHHGKLLVSHALSYITAARSGLSDSELEDLISLDDKVLDDIYQYHLPPVRRIPPLLWSRIRADLPGYLSERAADGVIVLNWYHEQFRSSAEERYFKNLNHLQNTHSAIADYFLGIWGGVPKPYQYTDLQKQRFGVIENEGLADRKVPKQTNIFWGKDNQIRFNSRKLNELPFHLLRARRIDELFNICLFNFEFLQAKLCSFPLQAIIADYEEALGRIDDPDSVRQLRLVMDGLRLSASLLSRYPFMLAFELVGRLLPLASDNPKLKELLKGCDLEAAQFNCFLPVHHCFHSPGGPLRFSLEEHPFAVFGMELTSDNKTLASTSNQLIVWDIRTGDRTRAINPNIEGIFLGMAVSKDDKYAVAYSNNNQIVVMSMISGEHRSIEPDGMENQMEIGKIVFTPDSQILVWSNTQFYLYDVEGKLLHRERISADQEQNKLIEVFFKSKKSVRTLTWTGERDDWMVKLSGREDGQAFEAMIFCASLAFWDSSYTTGICCIQQNILKESNFDAHDLEGSYAVVEFEYDPAKKVFKVINSIAENIDEKVNALFIWHRKQRVNGIEMCWIVAVTVDGFLLCQNFGVYYKKINLTLPVEVRNIPIRPMHTTSTLAMCCNDTIFVAGVRKNLYIFNVGSTQLVRVVDAHFGRILNLRSVAMQGQNLLISSSIDRSVKIWNMENIFEKSFAVVNMDQPIEKILLAKERPALAITQTRKYIGVWDIRSHRFITTLVTNIYGSVVTDCLISSNGRTVVCIESDILLLWDLKTQSVRLRQPAVAVHQIIWCCHETMIGIVVRHLDTPEQKLARFTVYSIEDFSIHYTHEFSCRMFRDVAVLKDTENVVIVVLFKGRDSLHLVNIPEKIVKHKWRPRLVKNQKKDVIVHRLIPMPHNANQLVVMDGENRGSIWDVRHLKLIRSLPSFGGDITEDGKLGLHAPNKGGLHIIDMKTGAIVRTLIGYVAEGVNDVRAEFTPTGKHVLYYHNGHQTLRAFRVSDGKLIGTFRPHAQITTWVCDSKGETIVIGGQDGSLLTAMLFDSSTNSEALHSLGCLPSRRYLAEHLKIPAEELDAEENLDIRNLALITKAAAKFKQSIGKKSKNSVVCSIM